MLSCKFQEICLAIVSIHYSLLNAFCNGVDTFFTYKFCLNTFFCDKPYLFKSTFHLKIFLPLFEPETGRPIPKHPVHFNYLI